MQLATGTERRLRDALGERVVFRWTGAPARGFLLRPSDALAIPFSLLWCGFMIFWEVMAARSGSPWWFRAWGFPFVLAGLYFVVGRFFVDAYFRAHTLYAIGETAAYIVRSGLAPRTLTLTANSLSPLEVRRGADGSGTILFGPQLPTTFGWNPWAPWRQAAFEGIPHVDEVYRLVSEVAQGN